MSNKVPFYPMYDYLTKTEKKPFPNEVKHAAKRHILNTIGVMIAATNMEYVHSIHEFADKSEKGKCTIVGVGSGYSPATAALYNGIAAHSLDMDDCSCTMNTHPSAVFVPALLAVAEYVGASGKQFLDAFIRGTVKVHISEIIAETWCTRPDGIQLVFLCRLPLLLPVGSFLILMKNSL